jgi:uncharacterized protein
MELTSLTIVVLVVAGVVIGNVSAMVGIGGGLLIVPLLVYAYGLDQKAATATSLAVLLPPVGVFAVIQYHRAGLIDWPVVLWLAVGFVIGALVGARLVTTGVIPVNAIRVIFAALLIYTAVRMLFQVWPVSYAVTATLLTVAGVFLGFWSLTLLRGKLATSSRLGALYEAYVKPSRKSAPASEKSAG